MDEGPVAGDDDETDQFDPEQADQTGMSACMNFGGALFGFISTVFSFLFSIWGALMSLYGALPVLLLLFAVGGISVPWVLYHDRVIEQGVRALVAEVYPLWSGTLREVYLLIRSIFNPLFCWWNAGTWWTIGMVREVFIPTFLQCGLSKLALRAGTLVRYVAEDILLYLATGEFLSSNASFARITPAGIALFQEWIDVFRCACSDLSDIFNVTPIVSPVLLFPPLWPTLTLSRQWVDPELWCSFEYFFNFVMAEVREIIKLTIQVLYFIFGLAPPNTPFIRPDLNPGLDLLCRSIQCFTRSVENIWQLWWDQYVPFVLVWHEFLCIVDSAGCIIVKTVGWVFLVLVNIDQAVSYPQNPWWETVSKPIAVGIINLWATPTPFPPIAIPPAPQPTRYIMLNYYLDTAQQATPLGVANPVYQQKRFSECLCIFITRIICDPSDATTACFSTGAQNLLMGFDFCCLTDKIGTILVDAMSSLLEASFHFAKGGDNFFLVLDRQPFTTIIKNDVVEVVNCLLSFFALVPEVGTCIRDLVVGLVRYILCMVDFLLRVIIGAASLPYFLIVLKGVDNFVMRPYEALDFFVGINNDLIADTPTSVQNCVCTLMNKGFPVPPIPCTKCQVGGFTPQGRKRGGRILRNWFDPSTNTSMGPLDLLRESWGISSSSVENDAAYHITPIIVYRNHTSNYSELFNLLYINVRTLNSTNFDLPDLKAVNRFVDKRKADMLKKWNERKRCAARAREIAHLRETQPKLYRWQMERGMLSGGCGLTGNAKARFEPIVPPFQGQQQQNERLTVAPTIPPTIGCDPIPECFDLCCLVRSLLDLFVHTLNWFANFINGLVQNSATLNGTTQSFPYFTGELADKGRATMESDTIEFVLLLFKPIKCVCNVINLVIPVVPNAYTDGRPDLCCFVQRVAEFIACQIQVLINSINSLALGKSDGYAYFTQGMFIRDVDTIFNIALLVVDCLCVFIRGIFPGSFIPGFADATDFDICCGVEAILRTITELLRLVVQVIITLATITINDDAYCYWRLDQTAAHNCGGTLDEIGVVKQLDIVFNEFFPRHTGGIIPTPVFLPAPGASADGNNKTQIYVSIDSPTSSGGACFQTCGIDNGASGIVPCICQVLNTLIPFRQDPSRKVNCSPVPGETNCQELDLCCFFSTIGFALGDLGKFVNRAVAAIWQPWTNGLPEFFVHYIWCVEPIKQACPQQVNIPFNQCEAYVNGEIPECTGTRPVLDRNGMVQYRCGEFTCGRFNVIIADLADPFVGLTARCVCELVGLLDVLMAFIFELLTALPGLEFSGWSCCFCGGLTQDGKCDRRQSRNPCLSGVFDAGSGILPAMSYVVSASLTAITNLVRQFPFSCYWRPFAPFVPQTVSQTWIFSFAGPTANALCIATGNLQCIAQSLFFLPNVCLATGQKFLGSSVRWAAEVVFRIVGFIEAFVTSFISEPYTCAGQYCEEKPGKNNGSFKGINAKALGSMLTILLSIPVDLLIGDSTIACTTVCPSFFSVPAPDIFVPPFYGCNSNINASCSCGCWNNSPRYGSLFPDMRKPYGWVISSDPAGVCRDTRPDISNTTSIHVGERFGRTDGCCTLQGGVSPMGDLLSALPVCQSPDDSSFLYPSGSAEVGFPGSCALFGACRPDALPSCANDPVTPPNLSINYRGAIDGIIIGFFRYLQCILDHLFTCQTKDAPCDPSKQYGKIFYPMTLIFSITWQILGGLIRFISAVIIFFFSLFKPPDGDGCNCWEGSVEDPYGEVGTQYYDKQSLFCYPCKAPRVQCGVPVDWGNFVNDGRMIKTYRCKSYCPVMQRLRDPFIDDATALARCINDYPGFQPKDNVLTATQACEGNLTGAMVYEVSPTYLGEQATCNLATCTITGTGTNTCACNPLAGGAGSCGGTPKQRYILLDLCPRPTCHDPAATISVGGQPGAQGFWPCGSNMFGNTSPSGPLVKCTLIQIIRNFLDVFDAFVNIFTQPIFVPPLPTFKRDERDGTLIWSHLLPPRVVNSTHKREPRRVWQQRVHRYSGLITGLRVPGPNFVEQLTSALYEYDTSDCWDDPVRCTCRNLDMYHRCYVDEQGQLIITDRSLPQSSLGRSVADGGTGVMPTSHLLTTLATDAFSGTSVCDHIVKQFRGSDWFTNVTQDEKHQYIKCLDRRIQGDRLHHIIKDVPADIMYNTHAPVDMLHNFFHSTRTYLREQHESVNRDKERAANSFEHHFPNWGQQLYNRTLFATRALQEIHGIKPTALMFDAIIKADLIWYKYETGYYGYALRSTADALYNSSSIFPSTQDALQEVSHSFAELRNIAWNQPYGQLITSSTTSAYHVSSFVADVYSEGVKRFVSRTLGEHRAYRTRTAASDVKEAERLERFRKAWYQSLLYRMLWSTDNTTTTGSSNERTESFLAPFMRHLGNVWEERRKVWQETKFSFWTADLHFYSLSDIIVKRWSKPRWRTNQLEQAEKLKRLYYKTKEYIWPGSVPAELHERFLFNSNCVLVDRIVNLTMKVVEICAAEALANLRESPSERMREVANKWSAAFDSASLYRSGEDDYYGWRNRPKIQMQHSVPGDNTSWIRPKWIGDKSHTIRHNTTIDHRVYRRQVVMERRGPAGFNFIDWIIATVEDIFGFAFNVEADHWYDVITRWLLNSNTNVKQWPDVGLLYWLRFSFVCNFPESYNCSIGTGLELGIAYTFLGFLGLILLSWLAFAPLSMPFQLIGWPLAIFGVFLAVAFHFPILCMIPLPPISTGFGVPACILDEGLAFLDKWITNCYAFILPNYMIAGDVCPTNPDQAIDFLNCRDVGVSDGVQNLLFLGVWLLGDGFIDFMLMLTAAIFGQWWPGLQTYMETTLNGMRNAERTTHQRMLWCFYATLPAVAIPLLFLFVGGILFAAIFPWIFQLLDRTLALFYTTPFASLLPGQDGSEWFGTRKISPIDEDDDGDGENQSPTNDDDDSDDDDDNNDDDNPKVQSKIIATPVAAQGWFTRGIRRIMFSNAPYPAVSEEKKKQ
jgi:hypothetical protein